MDKHESASTILAALKAGTPEAFEAAAPGAFIMAPVRGVATGRDDPEPQGGAEPAGVAEWERPTEEPRGARAPGRAVPGHHVPPDLRLGA